MTNLSEIRCSKCHQKPKRPWIIDGKFFCSACKKKIDELKKRGIPK